MLATRRSASGGNGIATLSCFAPAALRDTLIAGTIAAAAVGAAPRVALAHSHATSRQIGVHHTASKVALAVKKGELKSGEGRDRRRSLRAKLFGFAKAARKFD